jgi:hypothetical protein
VRHSPSLNVNLEVRLDMSYLDNLENSLKSLEKQEERDPEERRRREEAQKAEQANAAAAAPFLEEIKRGAFIQAFLSHASVEGRKARILVRPAWVGHVLRLEAGERRMEFRATPAGVEATVSRNGAVSSQGLLDLSADPRALAAEWLGVD